MSRTKLMMFLLGAASSCSILGLLSLAGPQVFHRSREDPIQIRVEGVPAADQLVAIPEGEQFVVPQGKTLVITGVFAADPVHYDFVSQTCEPTGLICPPSLSYRVTVNGEPKIGGLLVSNHGDTTTFFWGYPVPAGAVVEIDDNADTCGCVNKATILGYLANP